MRSWPVRLLQLKENQAASKAVPSRTRHTCIRVGHNFTFPVDGYTGKVTGAGRLISAWQREGAPVKSRRVAVVARAATPSIYTAIERKELVARTNTDSAHDTSTCAHAVG
jgi:hypothetical protein